MTFGNLLLNGRVLMEGGHVPGEEEIIATARKAACLLV